jgi:hypothetical protein
MKLRLIRPWGEYPAGIFVYPPDGLARVLIDKNIAVEVAAEDEAQPECTAMEPPPEAAVQQGPRRRQGAGRKKKA